MSKMMYDGDDEFVELLLHDFNDVLNKDEIQLTNDAEYMRLTELKFLLKNIRELIDIQLYQAYSRSETVTYDVPNDSVNIDVKQINAKRSVTDRKRLFHRRKSIDGILTNLKDYISKRLSITNDINDGSVITNSPRIIQLCDKYMFNTSESDILHLMIVVQGSVNPHVLNALIEEDYLRRISGFQRLSEMSEVGIEMFCDSERQHIKEGVVMVDEENGTHFNLRTPRTVVQILYGRPVKSDDFLKVSQTTLEDIINKEISSLKSSVSSPMSSSSRVKRRRRSSVEDSNKICDMNSQGSDKSNKDAKRTAIESSDSIDNDLCSSIPLVRVSSTGSTISNSNNIRKSRTIIRGPTKCPIQVGILPTGANISSQHWASAISNNEAYGEDEWDDEMEDYETGDEDDEYDEEGLMMDDNNNTITPGKSTDILSPSRESSSGVVKDDASILPYPKENQLEYLEECFQMVALMVRGNAARMKDDMKKEGTRMNNWDVGDVKHGRRELQAKLKLHESRVARRVAVTKEAGLPPPRLEVIAERLGLDSFEKKMVLLLIGKTVSPVVKALMETLDGSSRVVDDAVNVGQALAILCQDFQTQVANRKYFYRSGKLSHHGIISLSRSRWHQGSGDLTDNRIILDRRVLDWAVGLDSEINELVEGSDLYDPKVNLSQVVLPTGHLQALLSQCICYDAFRKYRVAAGLQEVLSYGNSLVIMLCGKSGTGKTMTVNAIAKELKMKVLLVDFASLTGKRSEGGNDMDADLRGLFREAQMSNAVLFFDECEVVFRSRNTGGDRMLNSLLTEIERHEGIVFLATNRPYDLDEAMHRRITCVLEFRAPDHDMRRCIWENLLGIGNKHGYNKSDTQLEIKDIDGESKQDDKILNMTENNIDNKTDKVLENISTSTNSSNLTPQGLQLDPDVDVAAIAIKYELTGGFIKNAVLSALLSSISRNKLAPVINQEDLKQGCKLQMRGALTQRSYEDKVIPTNGFDDIDLSPTLIDAAETIIRFEKARAKVYGSWSSICSSVDLGASSKESSRKSLPQGDVSIISTTNSQKACICALAGPKGSGKRTFMKALAFDLGRNIKMVHVADLMSGSIPETILSIQTLVQDARLSDAIVAIDGFEHVLDEGAAGAGEGGWRLHLLLSRMLGVLHSFPGCVVLICHMDSPQNLTLQQDLAMQLFCFLRFIVPPYNVRAKLWQRLLPGNAPLSTDISFIELGRRFEIQAGSIRAAIARASAEAAMREISRSIITQKDLVSAGDAEVAKLRGGNFELISKLFT